MTKGKKNKRVGNVGTLNSLNKAMKIHNKLHIVNHIDFVWYENPKIFKV